MSDLVDSVISILHPGISSKEFAVVLILCGGLLLIIFKVTRFFPKETEKTTIAHSGSFSSDVPSLDILNQKTSTNDNDALSPLSEPEVTSHTSVPSASLPSCKSSVCLDVVKILASSLFNSCLSKLHLLKGTQEICLNDLFQVSSQDSVSLRIVNLNLQNKPIFRDVELMPASPLSIIMRGKASFGLHLEVLWSSAQQSQEKRLPLTLEMKDLGSGFFHVARENDDLRIEAELTISLEDDVRTVVDGVAVSLKDFLLGDEGANALASLADTSRTFRFEIRNINRAASRGVTGSWQHFSTTRHRFAVIEYEESELFSSDWMPTIAAGTVTETLLPNGDGQSPAGSSAGEQLPVTEAVAVEEVASLSAVPCPQKAEGNKLVLHTPQDLICLQPRKVIFAGGVWKELDEDVASSLEASQSASDVTPHFPPVPIPINQHVEEDSNPLTESKAEEAVSHSAQEGDSSSLSGISGISGSSTRTYLGEASTLVIETVTNGIVEHYLIPHGLTDYSKLKKHGKKLHLFQDHAFVARHLPGGTKCGACGKSVGRLPPPIKQGYECRFCHLRCHKHCHVKLETYCPNSKAMEMELKYPRVNANGKLEF